MSYGGGYGAGGNMGNMGNMGNVGNLMNMPLGMMNMNSFGGGYGGQYGSPGRGRGGRRDDRRGGRGRGGFGGGNREPPPESSTLRMRKMIVKFGEEDDFDPILDPTRLSRALKRSWKEGYHGVFDGFRIGVTQEPHKHSYYVSLLLELSRHPPTTDTNGESSAQTGEKRKLDSEEPQHGREVLEDLEKAFNSWVQGREWMSVRLCLQYFSLLVVAGLVTPLSLLNLYKGLVAVMDEVGGGGDRSERAVRAVAEGLLRSGSVLADQFPDDIEGLVSRLEGYIQGRRRTGNLYAPVQPLAANMSTVEPHQDVLDQLLAALNACRENNWQMSDCILRHWESMPIQDGHEQSEAYELANVSMPPETFTEEQLAENTGEGRIGGFPLFAEDIVPLPDTLQGWTLRSLVHDLIHIFEVNRKEGARILLSLRQFLPKDLFKSPTAPASEDSSGPTLSLESLIISTLFSCMFTFPETPHPLVYYGSVITELCKLSPTTVAPPVGRAVRKMYGLMAQEGLDAEVTKRLADWLAVHLSNFDFKWMWKEWVPDLELSSAHPKRAFMRRVVDQEIRLEYYDRIHQSLPDAMLAPEAKVIESEPPEPFFPYEQDEHPLHAEATELLRLFRAKTSVPDIRSHIEHLPGGGGPGEPISEDVRRMVVAAVLHLGSRSFSHFLNATERYLDILRYVTPDPAGRQVLLAAVYDYWRYSAQQQLVTVDKYIQYGVLEGLDVVNWIFTPGENEMGGEEGDGWTDMQKWEVLKMCLDKHVGRVEGLKRRIRQVERDDEAAKARRAAEKLEKGEGVGEDADEDTRRDRSKAALDAHASLDIHMSNLEKVIAATTKHFVATLLPWRFEDDSSMSTSGQGLRAVLVLLDSEEEGQWSVRARLGWWREYLRLYQAQLVPLAGVIEGSVFSPLTAKPAERGSVERRAEELVRRAWAECVGSEA